MTVCSPSVVSFQAGISGNYKGFEWSNDKGLPTGQSLSLSAQIDQTVIFRLSAFVEPTENIIVNGSFTSGNTGFTTDYSFRNNIPFFQQELQNEGTYSVVNNPFAVHSGFKPCSDHTGGGNMMVINGSASLQKVWCQTVAVTPATDYIFKAYAASVHPSSPAVLQFSINGTLLGSPLNLTPTTCDWREFYTTWQSGASTSANICIVNQNTWTSGNDFAIDDIFFGPMCRDEAEFTVTYAKFDLDAAVDTVTVTNNAGCSQQLSFDVRGNTLPPEVEITGKDTIDCLAPASVLSLVSSQPLTGIKWRLLSGTYVEEDVLEVSMSGSYIAEATGPNACVGKDTIEVRYRDLMIGYDLAVSGELGCRRPEVEMTITPLTRVDSIKWLLGDFSYRSPFLDTVRVVSPQTCYFVTFAGESCVRKDSIRVTATDMSSPVFSLDAKDITCLNREGLISMTGPQDMIYIIAGDTVLQDVRVSLPGTYLVTGVNTLGCDSTLSVEVKAFTLPPALKTDTLSLSCKKPVQWLYNKLHVAGVTYTWTVDGISVDRDSLLAGDSGEIMLTATNMYGCRDSTEITLLKNIDPPQLLLAGDTLISCRDSVAELRAEVLPNIQVVWHYPDSDSLSAGLLITGVTGVYRLEVSDTLSGCRNSRTFSIDRQPKPESIDYIIQQPVCPGDRGLLQDVSVSGGTPPLSYYIGGKPAGPESELPDYGINQLTVVDANGCVLETQIDVDIPREIYLRSMPDTLINFGDSIRLMFTTNVLVSEVAEVGWDPADDLECDNCPDPYAKPVASTQYICTATTSEGCVLTDSTWVRVKPGTGYLAPNVMSGNGGPNGRFTIYPLRNSLESVVRLQVFDRWGGLLFEGLNLPPGDPAYGWDGTYGGKPVQSGVFVWVALLRQNDGSEVLARGNITVIR